jgi:hypothetical protein
LLALADAELIRACGQWQSIERKLEALGETRVTIDAEEQTQAEVDGLLADRSALEDKIEAHLPPKTEMGAALIAKLALDAAARWTGNHHCIRDVCNHMAWDALAFLYRNNKIGVCFCQTARRRTGNRV